MHTSLKTALYGPTKSMHTISKELNLTRNNTSCVTVLAMIVTPHPCCPDPYGKLYSYCSAQS